MRSMQSMTGLATGLVLALLSNAAPAADNVDMAMNRPDQFSWTLFSQIVAPAATSGNNNVLFETWASDGDTFQIPPRIPSTPIKVMHAPVLASMMPHPPGLKPHVLPGGTEEVRRNDAAFKFITEHNLHTVDGLVKAFASGTPIVFPSDAIEVKADWIPADTPGFDQSRYHINTASDGKQYALVSMHIISKLIPNWTWATFEHQDNQGRCDFIGCHDAFGAVTANVPPLKPDGQKYPSCQKTDAVKAVFATGKIDAVWQNYCLKGSQIDFTDSTGLPTHLGNSVPEGGFVNTSSCMTCHGRSAINSAGKATSQNGFLTPPPSALCPTGSPCSPNGTPLPSWFWTSPGTPSQKPIALQLDFVWAIPFCAVPHGQTKGPCS